MIKRLIFTFVLWSFFGPAGSFVKAGLDDSEKSVDSAPKISSELRRSFAELSSKVNNQPELQRLKAELENAQKNYAEAFAAAMKKEDAELFEKYKALQENEMERFNRARSGVSSSSNQSGYDQLSDEEKKRIYESRKQAMSVPAVKEAREKRNAAKTDEERKAAESDYKTVLKKAMLEGDKELEPLLNKLEGRTNPSSPNIPPVPAQ